MDNPWSLSCPVVIGRKGVTALNIFPDGNYTGTRKLRITCGLQTLEFIALHCSLTGKQIKNNSTCCLQVCGFCVLHC